jgi:hypothetical protein
VLPLLMMGIHLTYRMLLRLTGLYHWSWVCNPSQKAVKLDRPGVC